MYITVREALDIGPLREAALMAGSAGLDRMIQAVTVMDTPEIELWVHGGELLLTNAYVLKDEQARLVDMLEHVNAKGVAAVGLKVRDFLEDVIPQMVEVCERVGLPLISVPAKYPWVDIITPLFGAIIDRQVRVLRHALDVHERMTEIILQGGGLSRVAEQLAGFVESPVSILDAGWRHVLTVQGDPPSPEVLEAARQAVAGGAEGGGTGSGVSRAIVFDLPESDRRGAVVTIAANKEIYGYVVASDITRRLGAFDLVAMEQGALAASLEVLRERTEKAIERRLRDTFLFDLLSGNLDDPDLAVARAKARGWDITGPHVVALASLDNPGAATDSLDRVRTLRRSILSGLPSSSGIVWLELTDGVVLCIPTGEAAPDNATLKALGGKIKASCGTRAVSPVTVGLGRVYDGPMSLSLSYREASQAVALARQLWGGDRVVLYNELGFYRVLARYPLDSPEMESFCEETVGPIVSYDRKHGSELTRTLEVYLDCLGSWSQAAEVLNVHPNTLGYRMTRISDLLGVDLRSPEQRLNIELALKILRLREARRGPTPTA